MAAFITCSGCKETAASIEWGGEGEPAKSLAAAIKAGWVSDPNTPGGMLCPECRKEHNAAAK